MFQGCVFLKLRREIILLTNFPLTVSLKTQNRGGSSDYIKKALSSAAIRQMFTEGFIAGSW